MFMQLTAPEGALCALPMTLPLWGVPQNNPLPVDAQRHAAASPLLKPSLSLGARHSATAVASGAVLGRAEVVSARPVGIRPETTGKMGRSQRPPSSHEPRGRDTSK